MALIEDDDVIKTLTADRADDTLDIAFGSLVTELFAGAPKQNPAFVWFHVQMWIPLLPIVYVVSCAIDQQTRAHLSRDKDCPECGSHATAQARSSHSQRSGTGIIATSAALRELFRPPNGHADFGVEGHSALPATQMQCRPK